jgi:hypothetical protein
MVQLAPAATDDPQVLASLKSTALVPLKVMPVRLKLALPALVRVTTADAVSATGSLPNASVLDERVTAGEPVEVELALDDVLLVEVLDVELVLDDVPLEDDVVPVLESGELLPDDEVDVVPLVDVVELLVDVVELLLDVVVLVDVLEVEVCVLETPAAPHPGRRGSVSNRITSRRY